MPKPSVTVDKNDFAETVRRVRAAAGAAVRLATEDLKAESVALAPVLMGVLKESARTEYQNEDLTGIVSFNTPYAADQHESLEHAHPRGGQAKYLEQPLVNNMNRYRDLIADAVKRVLQ